MSEDRTTKILASLALLHDDLDAIRSELAGIRSDLDKIAADVEYQAGVIRTAEGSVKALVDRLMKLVGLPPARVSAAAPRVSLADAAAYGAAAAPGETSSFPLTPEQVHDLATAIGNAVANTYAEERKAEAAKRTGELVGKPVLVKPQPARPPIEERIRQLRQRGFTGYDAALLLMREHYPMWEIVRHLHVSPRRIAKLRKGKA